LKKNEKNQSPLYEIATSRKKKPQSLVLYLFHKRHGIYTSARLKKNEKNQSPLYRFVPLAEKKQSPCIESFPQVTLGSNTRKDCEKTVPPV
jgi:hypothetical protein